MNVTQNITARGYVSGLIEYDDGTTKELSFPNNVLLDGGRLLMAQYLVDRISHMVFGDGGYVNGVQKSVEGERKELFGITRVSKPVTGQTLNSNEAVFVATIDSEDGNGQVLNEMALEMEDGTLYSMATFPDLNKTENMKIHWTWRLLFS